VCSPAGIYARRYGCDLGAGDPSPLQPGVAFPASRKDAWVCPGGSTEERVRRLQSVTDAALAHLRLDELLAALLERTRQILEVDTCAILLLDERTNELVARAALGIEEEVEQGIRIPVGGGFAGRIAAEKQPVVLDDVDHAHVLNPILREKGIKSMLGVPLVVEGEARGVLHVGSLVPRAFREEEVELLQLVADRAALAIEHARLFEAERTARQRIEHVQAVTDAALAHLDVNELLNVLLPRIRDILETDTCAVLLLDEHTNELVARAALGIEEEVEQGVRIPLGAGFAGRVAAKARPLVIDVDEYQVYNPILRQKRIKSMLGVPLLVRGEALGVLHVGTLTKREFTQDEVELLQLVSERVARAIERARLYEELIQLDQLKLNFVAIASHELRTPATAVYGVLKTLAGRGENLGEELRDELLRVGVEQGERLRRLLEELLDLSRLDARAIIVEPRPLVLKAALAEVVHAALLTGDGVELDIPDDLAAVVDPLVLERVVSNLVANAALYGAPPIRIAAQQRDRHLRVAVEDAGPGVPKELEGKLFDRFARGGGESGHGLGLAIARAYAQAHGGDLVHDPRPGGARFELLIPQERNGLGQKPG
jgi:K+-sensing histidine kinase KdpD